MPGTPLLETIEIKGETRAAGLARGMNCGIKKNKNKKIPNKKMKKKNQAEIGVSGAKSRQEEQKHDKAPER